MLYIVPMSRLRPACHRDRISFVEALAVVLEVGLEQEYQ
eukprot:SAG11_NODE_26466_length_344_cov_159.138776_2_plen_38_part_01